MGGVPKSLPITSLELHFISEEKILLFAPLRAGPIRNYRLIDNSKHLTFYRGYYHKAIYTLLTGCSILLKGHGTPLFNDL